MSNKLSTLDVVVPDSKLAREITELVRDTETELLFNHSSRVYFSERSPVSSVDCSSTRNYFTPAQCFTMWV